MKAPEKNTERFGQTLTRTAFTTTVIAAILVFAHVMRNEGISKPALLVATWLIVFCIVFGGHWTELLFINYIKFMLPANLPLLYFTRIIYWFLSSVPLFMLACWVINLFTGRNISYWWGFGVFYIVIELAMNAIMQWKQKKSFYNGVY